MSRIHLDDSLLDMVMKMADGNPGAISVITGLIKKEPVIDPQSAWNGIGKLLALDDLGIYGSNIWILYKDKCGSDIRKVMVLLRACGHGFITREKVQMMASERMHQFNLSAQEYAELDAKVCAELDQFQKPE